MVAFSEAVKDVLFVIQLLGSMKIPIEHPVTVRIDNEGAIFMSSNITTTSHTKHVYVRYKYVNESIEYGVVKIIFIKSAANNNIHTKT